MTSGLAVRLAVAVKAGDEIAVTGYRNKDATGKTSGFKAKFEKGESTVASQTGLEFNNINAAVAESDEYGEPNTCTFTVPADADGSLTMTMTRSHTSTNLFITKLVITGKEREEGGEEPVVEYPILYTWDFTDMMGFSSSDIAAENTNYPETTNKYERKVVHYERRPWNRQIWGFCVPQYPETNGSITENDIIQLYNDRLFNVSSEYTPFSTNNEDLLRLWQNESIIPQPTRLSIQAITEILEY